MKAFEIIKDINPLLLETPEGRRELCRYNPLLFALIYLPHKLKDGNGQITLSDFHLDLCKYALTLAKKDADPDGHWSASIAPRGVGKSTWLFLIIPLWAGAYGYKKFAAAFSDASNQAEGHLLNFKMELRTNMYLQSDFPTFCDTLKGKDSRPIADSAWRTIRANGFTFDANGIDTNSLGKNALGNRPDLIILDDIEKGEKNYSEYQVGQQKNTVIDDIAPMGAPGYHLVFVGTTTMPNSIMDQFRKFADGYHEDKDLAWIAERDVKVFYYPAILQNEDGTERSIWPEKWPLEWLQKERHKRYFAKNFMNKPTNMDGQFWDDGDIVYDEGVEFGHTILSIDPAVTKNKVSDYTGMAVLSRGTGEDGKEYVFVREAMQVKLSPQEIANKAELLCELYDVGVIYVEVNQGGDLWRDKFKEIPAKFISKHQSLSKSVRAGKALNFYEKGMIRHTRSFPHLEEQMWAFPKVSHDDVLDAVVSGILFFLDKKKTQVTARTYRYTNA